MHEMTREEIAAGLRALDVCAGDKVMVHSSLKSFGRVRGGARTVIAALQDVLTDAGTLMMPSFNHGKPWREGGEAIFDPLKTPTTNGTVPETFWRMPGVFRSWDPTHAFACWGKDAERYTRFHHRTLTMGPDSPLGMLWREGGKGLLLGVDYGVNTFHHVVEMTLQMRCLGLRTEAYPVRLPDGRVVMGRTWGWRENGCPITDGVAYAPQMAGLDRRGKIGPCEAILFKLEDAFQVISRALREGSQENVPCYRCMNRPRVCRFTVESDWDKEKGCLKEWSAAWTY